MKRALLVAHRLIGLCAALFLIALGLTGSVIAFENDWNRMLNPLILRVTPRGQPLDWEVVRRGVEKQEPEWRVQRIYMPAVESESTYVRLVSRSSAVTREIYIDQYTGRILGRKELANQLIWKIHELHINLGAGVAGSQLVFGASIALLLLAVSGLYLWWPRRISRFRAGPQFSRTNYDLHRTLGFWSSVAMALFAITGINLHLQTGGGLFAMMDAKSAPVDLPGHGLTADDMLKSAAEALPSTADAHLVLGRKASDPGADAFSRGQDPRRPKRGHTRSQNGAGTQGGQQSHRAHDVHGAGGMEPRTAHGRDIRAAIAGRGRGLEFPAQRPGADGGVDLDQP